jgi:hypothetical protein
MLRLLGTHTPVTAIERLVFLVRGMGLLQTAGMLVFVIDDKYLRCFDRRDHIRTSGCILLSNTSFAPSRLGDATQYGPVNGWALRRFLKRINLPRQLHFADLGCGFGRVCILAAAYGFEQAFYVYECGSQLLNPAPETDGTPSGNTSP